MPITPTTLVNLSHKIISDNKIKTIAIGLITGLTLKRTQNDMFILSRLEKSKESTIGFVGNIFNSIAAKLSTTNAQQSKMYEKLYTIRG